ncbi:MAG: NAD(P)/FAD-dependent oxidoreductase [Pyrinomonadaceae bacterium]|nr:NAD(P)/FAD-dependent oxidoreductase [Pyrinomonadaceae bacterium]
MNNAGLYDAIIVGAGPAGTSAAIHLAMKGARVLLAEAKRFPRAKLCGEFISPECLVHFRRLGVMDEMIAAGGVELAETIFYGRQGRSLRVPSEWFANGGRALGLSRAEMDRRLINRARMIGVEVLEEAQAVGLIIEDNCVCGVQLKSDGVVRAYRSFVSVDATGRGRALVQYAARHKSVRLERSRKDVQPLSRKRASLVAFKAHLVDAQVARGCCEIYFYEGGYGGLSGVESGLSNLCFIASAEQVRKCGGDAERVMHEVVMRNRRAAQTLARTRIASEWLCVAIESFGRRELVPADGLITVGDAASFIDPFTGSGMLMALESGELAAEMIARRLPQLSVGESFKALATDYQARYNERFSSRLRMCSLLRRAAFAPPTIAHLVMNALNISERVRRRVARATRRTSQHSLHSGALH